MIHFQGKTVGVFSKDNFKGDFVKGWTDAVGSAKYEKVRNY